MSQCKVENIEELCVGDLISFYDPVFVTSKSSRGWVRQSAGTRCLQVQVLKLSKKGNVSLKVTTWPCREHDYQHGTIVSRRPEKILSGHCYLCLYPREDGTRGKLLYATAKSTHPDAAVKVMAQHFVKDEQFYSGKTFTQYNDEIARRCWDSEVQIRKQEEREGTTGFEPSDR
jgi:hypothetical protein